MNGLKQHKYMDLLSTFGMILGFGIILIAILTDYSILMVVGVILIFIFRTIGYGIDRIIEMKEEKSQN